MRDRRNAGRLKEENKALELRLALGSRLDQKAEMLTLKQQGSVPKDRVIQVGFLVFTSKPPKRVGESTGDGNLVCFFIICVVYLYSKLLAPLCFLSLWFLSVLKKMIRKRVP